MGVAEVLAQVRDRLPGTVKFIFQPAEEGPPEGENGGAELMLEEGYSTTSPRCRIWFACCAWAIPESRIPPRGAMAAADVFRIKVKGAQTHGALPWRGVDPIVVSAQIIMGLQTIASRQVEVTKAASVITIGMIRGGVRSNIIPDEVELVGTIRTLDGDMQEEIPPTDSEDGNDDRRERWSDR